MALQLAPMPSAPSGVKRNINRKLTEQFITVKGYNSAQTAILGSTIDDVEITIDLATYERMENDPTISKSKRIILTNVLTDDMQFAPSANEDDVTQEEWANYVEVMEHCQRLFEGLDCPYRLTLEQLLGNGIRYGHGLAEIEWELRYDDPPKKQPKSDPPKKGVGSSIKSFFGVGPKMADEEGNPPNENSLVKDRKEKPQLRLMPKNIRVKPRGAALFVVDPYYNVLGFVPRNRNYKWNYNQIIDRRKFVVLTLNKQDEDPRGKSFYRPAFNWYNLKTQLPAEMLRYIIEEIVPKGVATLPPDARPYEPATDENGDIIWNDPETKQDAKMVSAIQSMSRATQEFRSGSFITIPYDATVKPYKTGSATDSLIFNNILAIIEKAMEDTLLLQSLAQSEGQHQARSASETHKELLEAMAFWLRWIVAVMTIQDICKVAVESNFGPTFLKYIPFVSLGDFVRRDWARDLEVIAKAYFQGLLDDTQRPELMAWLNMPKPGPSRQQLMAEADINGEPVTPNQNRPDKTQGNKKRNDGNGTPKKENNNNGSNTGRGPLDFLGHHGKRFVGFAGNIFTGRR